MNPILRNILAVVAGFLSGSIINLGLISISGSVIAPPEGVDLTTMEGLRAGMHLMGPEHYVFPFLAHALGTLAGATVAALLAVKSKLYMALIVGVFFLIGGIANAFMLPAPAWFIATDLALAYLPMGWLGGKLAGARS